MNLLIYFFRRYIYIFKKFLFSKESYARYIGVKVGLNCRFIGDNQFGSEPYLIEIGNNVSLTSVNFITHDGGVWVLRAENPNIDIISPIKVGNNVFIGLGAIIMPGVTIGNDVIIGAGSIVTKDIENDSVVVGVPARKIKTVSKYKTDVEDSIVVTKGMTDKQKREFLLNKNGFNDA
ncbi:acyltransferase [Shewanella frigidimarina]|uniref:acyltransferase n=1 Tax=Shewanella frigidimarina TaxID=56812 RepID=UPI003D7A47FF